jgi:hypothetical protein
MPQTVICKSEDGNGTGQESGFVEQWCNESIDDLSKSLRPEVGWGRNLLCAFAPRAASFIKALDVIAAALPFT